MKGGKALQPLKLGSGIYKGGNFKCLHCPEIWGQECNQLEAKHVPVQNHYAQKGSAYMVRAGKGSPAFLQHVSHEAEVLCRWI